MKIPSFLYLLILAASYTHAETAEPANDTPKELQEYDIEIIIFEDAHLRYINSEVWPQMDVDDEVELEEEVEPVAIQPLTEEVAIVEKIKNMEQPTLNKIYLTSFENTPPVILNKAYKKLNASSQQKVLLYASWRQAGLDKSIAFDININELVNNHRLKTEAESAITGQFKIILARYLHFYSQLEYQRFSPGEQDNTQEEIENSSDSFIEATSENPLLATEEREEKTVTMQTFAIDNHRRMRSKELHYIDHPLVGMLIQINPSIKVEATKVKDSPVLN